MFGAAEPRLRPLDPAAQRRLLELRADVSEEGLRKAIDDLPAPRVRSHTPERSATVDRMLLDAATWAFQPRAQEP
jgi:hypothetical protein